MSIIITDKFQLRQQNFLDDRIAAVASSVSALKSWDFNNVPIPEGFEVYVGGVWYIYRSSHTESPTTGKFKTRTEDEGVDDLKLRTTRLEFEDSSYTASNFSQLLTSTFWTDSTGVNHARAGRIVTVTSDGANNGPWYLIASDYTKSGNWVKLIGRNDLITTTSGGTPSNTNIYSAAKADTVFPKKAGAENIIATWTFKENQVFEKNLRTNTLNANSGTITTLNSTTGNITNINSTTGKITNVTSTSTSTQELSVGGNTTTGSLNVNSSAGVGGSLTVGSTATVGGNLTVNSAATIGSTLTVNSSANVRSELTVGSTASVGSNLTVGGNLNATNGATTLKEAKIGTNGTIKDEDGKTVARVNKIVADESEIEDLDQHIRDQMGLIGVGNLLKNTSFFGQHNSKQMNSGTSLGGNTVVYNDNTEDWKVTQFRNIVADSDSITGYSMRLEGEYSVISQETTMSLSSGASYILSWKQKGTINVSLSHYTLDIQTILVTSRYKFCYAKIVANANRKETVTFSGGPGNIFEIKFEEGIIPTTWFPSCLDTDPIAGEINKYEYLKTTFLDCPERKGDDTTTNVFLKNQIKVGEVINDSVQNIYGGISGFMSDEKDVMVWSGGTYEKAVDLLSKIESDNTYLDNLTPTALSALTKSIITVNYKSIFTDTYAVGKFKGQHLDEDGLEMRSFKGITGFIPDSGGTAIGFTGGRLNRVDGSYPTSINFGGVTISFHAGLCTSPEGQYSINTGSYISGVTSLHLIFHKGYLVKVSSVKDYNTTYYWY